MELSPAAMEAVNQVWAKQIKEAHRALSIQLQPQLDQLKERIKGMDKLKRKRVRSTSTSNIPQPGELRKSDFTKDRKPATSTVKEKAKIDFKTKSCTSTSHTRCFICQGKGHYSRDCPNKKKFLLQDGGEIVTANSTAKEEEEVSHNLHLSHSKFNELSEPEMSTFKFDYEETLARIKSTFKFDYEEALARIKSTRHNAPLTSVKAKCDISSMQSDFVLDTLTPKEPVQPSSMILVPQDLERKSVEEAQMSLPMIINLENKRCKPPDRESNQLPSFISFIFPKEVPLDEAYQRIHDTQVFEEESQEEEHKSVPSTISEKQTTLVPIHDSARIDKPQKHCKDYDLVETEPSLFVMVSAQDEKRFGLEKVKEFCVSKSVFDSMIPTFEKLTLEAFLNPKSLLNHELHEFHSPLSVSELNDISELISTRNMLYKTFSRMKPSFQTTLNISEPFYESRNYLELVTNVLGHESVFKPCEELFCLSNHTFDVFALVFVKVHKGQVEDVVSNTRKRKLIFKENIAKFRTNREWTSLKSIKFKWKDKDETTCHLEKEKFSNTLILSDFFESCKREYYASRNGIGTTLMQDQKRMTTFNEKDGGELVFPLGATKSFEVMQDHFLWPHKKKGDVKRRCQSYVICKWTNTQPHGLHHSILIPSHSWNEFSFCFVELSRIRMDKSFIVLIMNMTFNVLHFVSFHKTSVNLHHSHLMFEGFIRLHPFLKIKLELTDVFHEFEISLSNPVISNESASCLRVFNFNKVFMLLKNVMCESTMFIKVYKPVVEHLAFEFSTSSIMRLFCPMSDQKGIGTKEKHGYFGEWTIKEKPPDTTYKSKEDELVTKKILIQEEPPDPITLTLMISSFKQIKNLLQVSNSLTRLVYHDLGTVIMSSLLREHVKKKLDLLKEDSEQISCFRKEKHGKYNVVIQADKCLFVYNNSMTVIIHLLFAKGVDYIAGVKEEPPDLEVLSSTFFARTGIGVDLIKELCQRHVLMKLVLNLGFLSKALKESYYDVEPHLKLHNNNAQSFDLQGKYNVSASFNVADLAPFIADDPDLRSNLFQEGGDDMSMESSKELESEDGLEAEEALLVPADPMVFCRANAFNKALRGLFDTFFANGATSQLEENANQTTLISIQAQ